MSKPKKLQTAGFISFSTAAAAAGDANMFSGTTSVTSGASTSEGGGTSHEPFYSGADSELRTLFKRLLKKDGKTRGSSYTALT